MAGSGSDAAPPEVLADLVTLLADCPAYADASRDVLLALAREAEVGRVSAPAPPVTGAGVVWRGGLLVHNADGRVSDVVTAGELLAADPGQTLEPAEPSLVVWLPERARALAWSGGERPGDPMEVPARAGAAGLAGADLGGTTVREVMHSPVASIPLDATCQEAAVLMRDLGVSSLIVEASPAPGIVTDRDLRTRLVAEGLPPSTPVSEVATVPARTIDPGATVLAALLEMVGRGIHHLPVRDGEQVVGMLSSGDLHQLGARSPMGLRVAVDRATDVDAVAAVVAGLSSTVEQMLEGGTRPEAVARVVATFTDRVQARVLELAFAALEADGHGGVPSAYGWLAFGSQARREQTLHTDQDTGLLLPDGLSEQAHAWWARCTAWVVDALERCGYPRCHGGVMASEPLWRHDVSGWRDRLGGLVHHPSEHHLLESAIAFDCRTVAGDLDAVRLLGPVVSQARGNEVFLARLARVAVSHRPPLGFLGRVTVERSGEHVGRFDVKKGAMLPIADLARLVALARGGHEVATDERLAAAVADGVLSADLGATLRAGYELATGLRLEHHVAQRAAGEEADNWLDPDALSPLDRSQLRETFKAVRTAQEAMASRYRTSMLG